MSEPKAKKQKTESSGSETELNAKRDACCSSVSEFKFNKKRVRVLSEKTDLLDDSNGVVYWMWREQRVQDNWALLYAQRLALKQEVPLHVCFCLPPTYLHYAQRHYRFMLAGLKEVEKDLRELDIGFHILLGNPGKKVPEFVKSGSYGALVTDFLPLRDAMSWVDQTVKGLKDSSVPICQVDAHNVVPCWQASDKLEYGARTIRPKITKQLQQFLTEFPPVIRHPHTGKKVEPVDWEAVEGSVKGAETDEPITWAQGGTRAGLLMLDSFCKDRLKTFHDQRNNPTKPTLSDLSPWFHFGQLSVQRAVLMVKGLRSKSKESVESFIEESVVRRELSDNFCYHNKNYDSIEGAYEWARKTLAEHKADKREYVYTKEQFTQSKTHDDLWNAAQKQLVLEGKMHGFLRMYWAKKILEWTESPEKALELALYFNDRYSLDGNDPNGYVGCMWSICGVHDQGWKERPVFGKIRYMNYNGCKRKFDVDLFVQRYKANKARR